MNEAQKPDLAAPQKRLTRSTEETILLGTEIASMLRSGDVVLLVGGMGAGKTYLTKGIVSALGGGNINEVNSPAYDIVHEFSGSTKIFHYDLFKIDHMSPDDVDWLLEAFQEDGIHIVEWGNRIPDVLKCPVLYVTFEFGEAPDDRIIELHRTFQGAEKRAVQ